MIVKWSPAAARQLENQIDYIVEHDAPMAARRLQRRVHAFAQDTLALFRRNGHYLIERDLWETWIPRTRFVIWYRFDDNFLEIVALFHTSHDRADISDL